MKQLRQRLADSLSLLNIVQATYEDVLMRAKQITKDDKLFIDKVENITEGLKSINKLVTILSKEPVKEVFVDDEYDDFVKEMNKPIKARPEKKEQSITPVSNIVKTYKIVENGVEREATEQEKKDLDTKMEKSMEELNQKMKNMEKSFEEMNSFFNKTFSKFPFGW